MPQTEEILYGRHFTVFPAKAEDVPAIARNLREGDRLELERAFDDSPEDILLMSIACSERAWTAFAPDGEPVAIWGVARCAGIPGMGAIWLMGTPRVDEKRSDFLWLSRHYTRVMSRGFAFVCNLVDAQYAEARRWLQWLGFREGNIVKSAKGHDFVEVFKAACNV